LRLRLRRPSPECESFDHVTLQIIAFTDKHCRYNAASHPMPYMKASQVIAPQKASKEKPDLEEALDESEDEAPPDEAAVKAAEDAEGDLSKDKYVKAPKKKKAPAAAKGKGKGKKAAAADDDDDDEEDVKPVKGKGKAAAKPRAKK
jgi:replication factor C subunit 1